MEQLKRVHSPIGLGIGAETPEEIAVSIHGAEVLMLRGGGTGKRMKEIKVILGEQVKVCHPFLEYETYLCT